MKHARVSSEAGIEKLNSDASLQMCSKTVITVEVCQRAKSKASIPELEQEVEKFLQLSSQWYTTSGQLDFSTTSPYLVQHAEHLSISNDGQATSKLFFWQVKADIIVYKLQLDGCAEDDEVEDGVPKFVEWDLPSREFHTIWETLIFDSNIQERLVSHATMSLVCSQKGVNPNLVAWNKVVFLHGPPGTGKTSLCKAIAQKLTIRLNQWYKTGHLIEVNAHSLFSKWFSESGKLVTKLFRRIMEFVEESDELVFVLIDEVESLTSARSAAVGGSEPSDAIRAVNSLLTHIDSLKNHPNVMVLCTSNLPEAVDAAFVDRADIKAYIGPPGIGARYEMLRSSIAELQRTGLIIAEDALPVPWSDLETHPETPLSQTADMEDDAHCTHMDAVLCGSLLRDAAALCDGLSGRTLIKLPFRALAAGGKQDRHCQDFIKILIDVTEQEISDREKLVTG